MRALAVLVALLAAVLLAVSLALAEPVTPTPTPPPTPQPTDTPTPVPTMPGCFPGVTPSSLAPAAPSNLRIEYLGLFDGYHRLILKWDDNSVDEVCFGIEKKVDDGPWEWGTPIPANWMAEYVIDIDSGGLFCHRVYAGNEAGRSAYSDEACIELAAPTLSPTPTQATVTAMPTPRPPTPAPPPIEPVAHCGPEPRPTLLPDLLPPSNLDAQLVTLGEHAFGVHLVWQDNSADETCFGLQRKAGEEGVWLPVQWMLADTTEATDEGFYIPGLYCYRVYAGKAEGTSVSSNEACLDVEVVPSLVYGTPTPLPSATPVPVLVVPNVGLAAGGGGQLAVSGVPSSVWWAMAGAGLSLLAIAALTFATAARPR